MQINIPSISNSLEDKVRRKLNVNGALGILEDIAIQFANIQHTLSPEINRPTVVIFSGDHGIAEEGVSFYPQSVTYQMLYNYMHEGAAINVFAKQHQLQFQVVDTGVAHHFPNHFNIINKKLGYGTNNYRLQSAMSRKQCLKGITNGFEIIEQLHKTGCNTVIFGEKGIGNTSSATLLLSILEDIPLRECVGRGTGLNSSNTNKKYHILKACLQRYQYKKHDPIDVLTQFGGFEIVTLVGAMLKAAQLQMCIIIDGFIITSALLAASKINKKVIDYCLFAHQSNEKAHKKMLQLLNAKPILDIGMRLGEGTGAAVCYPIIKNAVTLLNTH